MPKKKEKQHIVANEKAITLIALVVTIVILLILAGVTITMTLGQNGLFTRAREGRAAYEESEVRDDLSMLITQYTWDKASEKTDKSLGDYLKDNGATSVKANADGTTLEVEYKGYVFTVNKDSGEITGVSKGEGNDSPTTPTIIPKVGEIVSYTPDTPSTGYDLSTAKSGYSSAQTIDSTYEPTTWKIMEIDENGNITKLFGVPSSSQSTVYFRGSTGYNNGVYLLNDICKTRYGNASLGATARSLTIEDIESRMNATGIAARNAYKSGTTQYGTTRKYTGNYTKYPALYEQEKYAGVKRNADNILTEVSDVDDGTQVITGSVNATAQAKMNPNGKTQSEDVYTAITQDTSKTASTTLTCTQTFWGGSQSSSYYDDTNFYNMIFGTGTQFWLASRWVNCNSDTNISYASFGLRGVSVSGLYGLNLFASLGSNGYNNYRLAPVVSLGSGIQVKSGEGTTEKPYVIGK